MAKPHPTYWQRVWYRLWWGDKGRSNPIKEGLFYGFLTALCGFVAVTDFVPIEGKWGTLAAPVAVLFTMLPVAVWLGIGMVGAANRRDGKNGEQRNGSAGGQDAGAGSMERDWSKAWTWVRLQFRRMFVFALGMVAGAVVSVYVVMIPGLDRGQVVDDTEAGVLRCVYPGIFRDYVHHFSYKDRELKTYNDYPVVPLPWPIEENKCPRRIMLFGESAG